MANWRRQIGDWIGGRTKAARRFDAAKQSRLAFGWTTANTALNAELRMDLEVLRARSRDLAANNDYARKFLSMVRTNIVGPNGFNLQSQCTKPNGDADTADRRALETAFEAWSQPGEFDVTGRLSFVDGGNLIALALARDGEALVRRVRSKSFRFGYRQQVLDIDRLDPKHNETLANGNSVIMGVEVDTYGGPVAYHLLTRHPGESLGGTAEQKRERVPARDIFHLFIAERPEQVRGVPWMHTAMLRLQMLNGYEEAAIVAARTGAAKMGFFVSPDGTAAGVANEKDEEGNFITDAEAGAFQVLPEGYDFKPWSPEYPTQNYDSFVKATLRGLASGLGVAYNSLANDLEGVNFSSIRSGTLEERDAWMVLQGWLIRSYLRPTFLDWLESALLAGAITTPAGFPLPAGKVDKFRAHTWQGRRWSWVDPLKDIQASVMAIENGLASPYTIAQQQGLDVDDVLDDIARFQKAAAKLGVKLGKPAPEKPAPPPAPEPDPTMSKLAAIALMRMGEPPAVQQPQPITIHNAPPAVTLHQGEIRNEITVQPTPPTPIEIRNEITTPEQPAPHVEVRVEAVMPEQPAPQIEVNVETPDTLHIASLPGRRTSTEIVRDAAGDIVSSTQVERDA